MRVFRRFSYRDTNLRVCCERFNELTDEIVAQRKSLEKYIVKQGAFLSALSPLELREDAPEVARRMAAAAHRTGLGPMAAVAGTLAQLGVEKALSLGAVEAIVENGGDMYLVSHSPVTIGIHSGDEKFKDTLAFHIESFPLSVCSSSSRMGHSLSMGNCSLATAVSTDGALADAAATLLCNSIRCVEDMPSALERVGAIDGVNGVLAIIDGQIGLFGNLPKIVKNHDADLQHKITRDRFSR